MPDLQLRPAEECRYAAVALGEVMLRLDPGETRIRSARTFSAWEGGGEYNVIRGLSRVFGLPTTVITALVDNEVGHLIESLMMAGGVDTSWVHWADFDGVGRAARNGINFTERGFGVRAAKGVSDRGHTPIASLRADQVDLDRLFGELGVQWLHTGGIVAALSESSSSLVREVMAAARRHGTRISYDLNYRPSLWRSIGGKARARTINRELVEQVDLLLGNEEDFTAALGFTVDGVDENLSRLPLDGYREMIARVAEAFPNLAVIATSLRTVRSASSNDWGAVAWSADTGLIEATLRPGLEILDRVGGGDSFASGLIYGLLSGEDLSTSLELGAAHGALAMTTPGDTSMATRSEVVRLANGRTPRVER
jgi:Sugar kinases, ribokinase family